MYRIELSQAALKALENIPRTELKKIQKKIDALEQNPRLPKTEKLSGSDCLPNLRQKAYRFSCDYRASKRSLSKSLIQSTFSKAPNEFTRKDIDLLRWSPKRNKNSMAFSNLELPQSSPAAEVAAVDVVEAAVGF